MFFFSCSFCFARELSAWYGLNLGLAMRSFQIVSLEGFDPMREQNLHHETFFQEEDVQRFLKEAFQTGEKEEHPKDALSPLQRDSRSVRKDVLRRKEFPWNQKRP